MAIKRSLEGDYKALCNPPEAEGVYLLGEDIPERIREISEASKLGQKLVVQKDQNHKSKGRSEYQIMNHDTRAPSTDCILNTDFSGYRAAAAPPQAPARERQEGPQVGAEAINQVWSEFVDATIDIGRKNATNFQAGRLRQHVEFWKTLTTDNNIIKMVLGAHIKLTDTVIQETKPVPYFFPLVKRQKIDREISELLRKGVLVRATNCSNGFVSRIFTRDKTDGNVRLILDLSEFNESVEYKHFKMESLQTAIKLMTPGCYMASIDWKDAYYSVPIAKEYQKYLRFEWGGRCSSIHVFPTV